MTKPPRRVLLAALLVALAALPSAARADTLAPDAEKELEWSTWAGGLLLPTALEFLPDGRAVIVEKQGRVVIRKPSGDLVTAATLDVDSKTEKGLLNVVRHPNFDATHDLAFYYSSAKAPDGDKHKIALIQLGSDDRLNLASERVLVRGLRGPDDHEMGGGLAVDRTGHLLIGVGDTGCRARKLPEPPYAPTNYFATCLTNGNGKILRIGFDGSIPKDNPLVPVEQVTACGEQCGEDALALPMAPPRKDIWVWGVRNPWRLWVDPRTGNVWTGDVGDLANEEIDVIDEKGGGHYGWPFREGGQGHPTSICEKTTPNTGACVEPAYYCRHDDVPGKADAGCKSINGGLILDDCRWPADFRGKYVFGDNANGRIWTVQPTGLRDSVVPHSRKDVGQVDGFVVDFDMGPDGALYATVMRIPPEESKIIRIAPKAPIACDPNAPPPPLHADVPEPPAVHPAVRRPKAGIRRRATALAALLAAVVAAVLVIREAREILTRLRSARARGRTRRARRWPPRLAAP